MSMLNIETRITINAPAERVYSTLTKVSDYSNWNPFIIDSSGQVEKGRRIRNVMRNGDSTMTFKPKILVAEAPHRFEWLGSLWVRGLFDGHHYFRVEPAHHGGVVLVHGEHFSGLLARYVVRKIGAQTRENFESMNQALKAKVEMNLES